eukprot:1027234-Prorocentrum_lima.AAC.1
MLDEALLRQRAIDRPDTAAVVALVHVLYDHSAHTTDNRHLDEEKCFCGQRLAHWRPAACKAVHGVGLAE